MRLSVFHEFVGLELKDKLEGLLTLDHPSTPTKLIISERSQEIVKTNAKLFYDPQDSRDDIEEVLKTLIGLGFKIITKNPYVTHMETQKVTEYDEKTNKYIMNTKKAERKIYFGDRIILSYFPSVNLE